ncbi:nucleoside-diphosphate-sugar epimerase [Saprospira grandis DSM 2844]|uniref:Nucleoside-diphosphate-sugar epimerase n=1 Tax=Saprospira grandis DSM 2844 TaxID=694433 RepID=J1I4Q1_9BACT|nr:SDR family oxidoreductase [Saprospira grandis]EJF53338.1 nucleoside-diphosphate-sugar epimerase [Saprospira grandis DSM 2844]
MYQTAYHDRDLSQFSVLITGGAGFIGSNLVEYFLKYGAKKVRVIDNFLTGFRENLAPYLDHPHFELIEGDISHLADCEKACEGMNAVCHQAALGSVPRSVAQPHLTTLHNVNGFVNMVHAAHQAGIKRFVYASSSSVYGDEPNLPKVEDRIGQQLSPYAITKYSNELFAKNFGDLYGMEFMGFRYFNVFGPKQSPKGAYAAVIPLFAEACLLGKTAYINGDGLQTRDFTFIENVVQMNVKALLSENPAAYNQVYNVGVGGRYSVLDLYEGIRKAAGSEQAPVHRESRAGDIRDSQANIEKAKTLLGYDPGFSFEEGLAITVQHFKQLLKA